MKASRKNYRRGGQSIVETVVGIIFLIPVVLILFDVGVLVLANTANDTLAKNAARAAASATNASGTGTADAARTAALAVVGRFGPSPILTGARMERIAWVPQSGTVAGDTSAGGERGTFEAGTVPAGIDTNPGAGQVAVVTGMVVQVPVPIPFASGLCKQTFYARAVEPIVSLPP